MSANIASARIHVQRVRESIRRYEEKQAQIQTEEPKMPITYEELEKAGYMFREKNIYVDPQPVRENPWLCQQEIIQKYIKQAGIMHGRRSLIIHEPKQKKHTAPIAHKHTDHNAVRGMRSRADWCRHRAAENHCMGKGGNIKVEGSKR